MLCFLRRVSLDVIFHNVTRPRQGVNTYLYAPHLTEKAESVLHRIVSYGLRLNPPWILVMIYSMSTWGLYLTSCPF